KDIRKKSFAILFSIKSEKDAIKAAAQLIQLAQEQVELRTAASIEKELDELKAMMQNGSKGMLSGGAKAVKDLERDQKTKFNRAIKDELDGYLLDYASFFRDCLSSEGSWINSDLSNEISTYIKQLSQGSINTIVNKLNELRERLATNASQPLLLEAFFSSLALHSRGNQHPIL
ncbi:MAG: hypothetical protein EBW15_10385, partial [Actinobacteria bacterium]|nr:hypothetical protein [Actinomycetota bacterium]